MWREKSSNYPLYGRRLKLTLHLLTLYNSETNFYVCKILFYKIDDVRKI